MTADHGARRRAVHFATAAAALLAAPAAAQAAAEATDPPSPQRTALRAPVAGHVTVAGQMRAAGRSAQRDRRARAAQRRRQRAARRERAFRRTPVPSQLGAIAACESGGDYATNTGNGFYGAYQFDVPTWRSVGGSGLPSEASPAEQDMRAARLYARAGAAPWPVCGQMRR